MHSHYTTYLFYFTIGFLCLILVLIAMILGMMIWKRSHLARHKRISAQFVSWLTEIVLEEYEEKHRFVIPEAVNRLLRKQSAREVLLNELITLKKNLNGSAGQNLRQLYIQLELPELSLEKLESPYWHIKAKGMQELAIMNQRQYFRTICGFLNDPHPLLRMEAQTALVRYHGFKGLNFLNTTTYHLTEWQQLSLLQLLLNQPVVPGMNIKKLLHSPNTSAIEFALRLITEQHDAGYYDQVKECLHHGDNKVKKQAILCLAELATPDTALLLINECMQYDKETQLTVLQVIERIGNATELEFLHKQILSADPGIRLACMKAIQAIKQNKAGNNNYYPEEIPFLQTA